MPTDFFQSNTSDGLQRIRNRLLDLTLRNRLLSFKHTKRGAIRIVNELPDQLFERLLNGAEMTFDPVPDPPRGAAEAIRGAESSLFAEQDSDGAHGEIAVAVKPSIPTATTYAAEIGIPTSYDLPQPSAGAAYGVLAEHADKFIQTLHYARDLEKLLRNLTNTARTAIEETGTNMLYLVLGFLEWYEADSSEKAHHAPLIMLPVALRRGDPDVRTGMYRYHLAYSGEDVTTNISLQEKMKEFGVQIPDVEEDVAPEEYFERVAAHVRSKQRWKVRRQATLTLLSFGKLLMYRDLDPANWPEGAGPSDHPRVREFFEGTPHEGLSMAQEYALDELEASKSLPPVIMDADSSQHSAIVDALQGKNLVIEGPPGTGKSQTITNLIAAAMAQGKKVLFVAEKLAALEVVRNRLDNAGLGVFCLELHSHKTQKAVLLQDIGRSIDERSTFADPKALDQKYEVLLEAKRRLTAYAKLINEPFGRLERSIHDVIWQRERFRQELPCAPSTVEAVEVEGAAAWSLSDLEVRRQAVIALARSLENALGTCTETTEHPWYGVRAQRAGLDDERAILEVFSRLRSSATEVLKSVKAFEDTCGWAPAVRLVEFDPWLASLADLPSPGFAAQADLLPSLINPQGMPTLLAGIKMIAEIRALTERIRPCFSGPPELNSEHVALAQAATERAQSAMSEVNIEALREFAVQLDDLSKTLEQYDKVRQNVEGVLRCSIPSTIDGLVFTAELLKIAAEAPLDVLHLRHEGMEGAQGVGAVREAQSAAAPLLEQRSRLDERVDLGLVPTTEELKGHLTAVVAAGPFRLLETAYRTAKRTWLTFQRERSRVNKASLTDGYRELVSYASKVEVFDKTHAAAFGQAYKGLDTPFDAFMKVFAWQENVQQTLTRRIAGSTDHSNAMIARQLGRASTDDLRTLIRLVEDAATWGERLQSTIQAIRSAEASVPGPRRPASDAEVAHIRSNYAAIADDCRRAYADLQSVGLRAEVPVSSVGDILQCVRDREGQRQRLRTNARFQELVGTRFDGEATAVEPLEETLDLAERLHGLSLPEPILKWLAHGTYAERREALMTAGSHLKLALESFEADHASAEKLAELDVPAWYGKAYESARTVGLERVLARIDAAFVGRTALGEWLDYQRARVAFADLQMGELLQLLDRLGLEPDDLSRVGDFVLHNSLAKAAIREHPALLQFNGMTHEQVRTQFQSYDYELLGLFRQRIAHQIASRRITHVGNGMGPVSTYTDLALLNHERNKQRRHVPIRQLVRRAGQALQELKPCFMMGPLSVAQYLEPGRLEFDLIVMDEASQLRPEDALGAIARAHQVIVVGDPKQLPPTSFFDKLGEEEVEEEETTALDESESILEVASSLYQPIRRLRWHYRSRHGSLIAFSNSQFYKDLLVFPSPVEKSERLGVRFTSVPAGVYHSGRNEVEADRVVDAILHHVQHHPGESLGVATLNSKQRDLIDERLQQRLRTTPDLRELLEERRASLEPFFIKNLENVQGDERDVIMVSITFGKDQHGRLYQRFGPINGKNGYRRLNVLFTRAKRRVEVFCSFDPDELQLDEGSAFGAHVLKNYLSFARTGVLPTETGGMREPDSDFEVSVAQALRQKGYDVVAQVGVAGYFIDLAVRHPHKRGAFIMGIECDGATYHSSYSARDRDRLRESVLRGLGWEIHRVWSTDWFKQPDREISRIAGRLQALVEREPGYGRDLALSA